ncbi:MAG: large conductance mechanosensitive channel protein MscL [Pseudomonadota bacterium]
MLQEFREFAVKGNVVDMGVGIVIGAAFTTIVRSFVDDIVNPLLGVFTGGIDFSELYLDLSGQDPATLAAAKEQGLAVVSYGVFINAVITFLIVAWILFFVVRGINRLRRRGAPETESAPEAPPTPTELELLGEIRDLLKAQRAG